MRRMLPGVLLVLLVLQGTCRPAAATVRMPAFFGDHMVLQARSFGGTRAFLSGWAAPDERVTVWEGDGKAYYATAGVDGSWSLQLDPRPYSSGSDTTLTVTGSSGGPAVVANNVTFGDVIICSGDSTPQPSKIPDNVRVFMVGTGSAPSPPPPGRSDVPPGSVGWHEISALRNVSTLCVQTAAELSALRKSTPIGLIVAAVPGSSLLDWVPTNVATNCLGGGDQMHIGRHYNAMVHPFSMTSTRAAWWALDEPANTTVGGTTISATDQACLFRAMINGWRDAQPTGDYSFIFAQSKHSTASAIAQAAALPHPALLLGGSAKHGSGGFPNDKQVVDSTGVAVADESGELLARRMALSMLHVAFAQQPSSIYAGPMLTSAILFDRVDAASTTAGLLHFGAVAPGRLLLQPVRGCSRGCCGNDGDGLDLRLATSADLSDPDTRFVRATAVTVSADGAGLHATFGVGSDSLGQYTVAMLVGGSECALVGSASNISAVVSAVAIDFDSRKSRDADVDADVDTTSTIVATRGLFAAPALGWNHWNAFHCDVSERLVVAMADAMVASGMAAAGFEYINLDDCWMVERAANGSITPDPVRFPSGIKALADYIHSKGLKFGIYQAPGNPTPQGRPGLLGHEAQDVATFCEWGVDYIKLDSKGSTRDGWDKVRTAIDACTRQPMYLQVAFCRTVASCDGWMDRLANAWRTSGDSQATWASVMNNMDSAEPLWPLSGPSGPIGGHWNDADLLQVGDVGLSQTEQKSQFEIWAIMNMPILMSSDLRKLLRPENNVTRALLTNERIIALNQDPLGYQGRRLISSTPAPAPAKPQSGVVIAACGQGRKQQQQQLWQLRAPIVPGSDLDAVEIIHVASGKALTITNCESKHTPGLGAWLSLEPINTSNTCGGRNQLWTVQANGTITSSLDGHCMDVDAGPKRVQSHFCVNDPKHPSSGVPPTSEHWHVSTVGGLSTIRFGVEFGKCVQPAGPDVFAQPKPSGAEVWEKQLAGGDIAVMLLNRGSVSLNISVDFSIITGINRSTAPIRVHVTDVDTGEDRGIAAAGLSQVVESHGVAILRLSLLHKHLSTTSYAQK